MFFGTELDRFDASFLNGVGNAGGTLMNVFCTFMPWLHNVPGVNAKDFCAFESFGATSTVSPDGSSKINSLLPMQNATLRVKRLGFSPFLSSGVTGVMEPMAAKESKEHVPSKRFSGSSVCSLEASDRSSASRLKPVGPFSIPLGNRGDWARLELELDVGGEMLWREPVLSIVLLLSVPLVASSPSDRDPMQSLPMSTGTDWMRRLALCQGVVGGSAAWMKGPRTMPA